VTPAQHHVKLTAGLKMTYDDSITNEVQMKFAEATTNI
jgi:hypothetical protein